MLHKIRINRGPEEQSDQQGDNRGHILGTVCLFVFLIVCLRVFHRVCLCSCVFVLRVRLFLGSVATRSAYDRL